MFIVNRLKNNILIKIKDFIKRIIIIIFYAQSDLLYLFI